MSEKFCLKWNDFNSNASRAFGLLRGEDFLQDVTLVGDDNSQIAAHKLVLSACSEYFKNIFKNNSHSHPLLCLEGVTSKELKDILDYIYNGEVNIFQEELDRFLTVAQRFKLEGLLNGENEEGQGSEEDLINHTSRPLKEQRSNNAKHEKPEPYENFDTSSEVAIPTENNAVKFFLSEEEKNNLKETTDQHLERAADGSWSCKICGKSTKKRQQMEYHVEGKHLEGLSLPCNLCGKLFRSRNSLQSHASQNHKKILFQDQTCFNNA